MTYFLLFVIAYDLLVNTTIYHPQWQHCAIPVVGGADEGPLEPTTCVLNKTKTDSSIKVVFNGNIRTTNCQDCCMRWFITLNGEECSEPAPVEAVLYLSNAQRINVHKAATVAGACSTNRELHSSLDHGMLTKLLPV